MGLGEIFDRALSEIQTGDWLARAARRSLLAARAKFAPEVRSDVTDEEPRPAPTAEEKAWAQMETIGGRPVDSDGRPLPRRSP